MLRINIADTYLSLKHQNPELKVDLYPNEMLISPGLVTTITGKSGSGKSSFLNNLLGFQSLQHIPDRKTFIQDPYTRSILDNKHAIKTNIHLMPQDIEILTYSLEANISLSLRPENWNKDRIFKCLEMVELSPILLANRQKGHSLEQSPLSGGEKKRIGIARALYSRKRYLFFDEPTSGLDSKTEESVLNTISTLKRTYAILILTHSRIAMKHSDLIYNLSV